MQPGGRSRVVWIFEMFMQVEISLSYIEPKSSRIFGHSQATAPSIE